MSWQRWIYTFLPRDIRYIARIRAPHMRFRKVVTLWMMCSCWPSGSELCIWIWLIFPYQRCGAIIKLLTQICCRLMCYRENSSLEFSVSTKIPPIIGSDIALSAPSHHLNQWRTPLALDNHTFLVSEANLKNMGEMYRTNPHITSTKKTQQSCEHILGPIVIEDNTPRCEPANITVT